MSSLSVGSSNFVASMPGDLTVSDQVGVAMLKKTLDMEQQSAAQLLQTLPAPASNNPPHLGNAVDTHA